MRQILIVTEILKFLPVLVMGGCMSLLKKAIFAGAVLSVPRHGLERSPVCSPLKAKILALESLPVHEMGKSMLLIRTERQSIRTEMFIPSIRRNTALTRKKKLSG